jgi:hypothetical protein
MHRYTNTLGGLGFEDKRIAADAEPVRYNSQASCDSTRSAIGTRTYLPDTMRPCEADRLCRWRVRFFANVY